MSPPQHRSRLPRPGSRRLRRRRRAVDTTPKATPSAAADADLGADQDLPARAHGAARSLRSGQLQQDAQAYYDLAKAADFDYAKLLADNREEVAAAVKAIQDDHIEGQPGLRGDGGRRRGRPELADYDVIIDAGRRQVRPRERRAVLARDAERAQVRAAGQLLRAGRDLGVRHRAEVHRQGRRGRPRRRRQGRRSRRRCRTPTSCSPRRPTSSSTRRSSTSRPRSGSRRSRTRSRPWS